MILSNSALCAALDEQRLVIDPEPWPRDPADDPEAEWPYGTSSVDLRLGDEVSWFKEALDLNVDLRRGKFTNLFEPSSSSRKITEEQPYVLMPGRLVLANTLERAVSPGWVVTSHGFRLAQADAPWPGELVLHDSRLLSD